MIQSSQNIFVKNIRMKNFTYIILAILIVVLITQRNAYILRSNMMKINLRYYMEHIDKINQMSKVNSSEDQSIK